MKPRKKPKAAKAGGAAGARSKRKTPLLFCAPSTFNKAIIFDEGYCGMGDNTTG